MLDQAWGSHYRLPPPGNMMERHARAHEVFIKQGSRMFSEIESCITRYAGPIPGLKILDFGCGVGRVALPFFFKHRKPDHCVDVDPAVIDYLRGVIPEASPEVIGFDAPTRFPSVSFDVIYAVSVWTHLPPGKDTEWLAELRRLLKPGGVALVTTTGYSGLAQRRKHMKGWESVTDDDLRREGMIFKKTPPTPGTKEYGMVAHSPEWIRENWTNVLEIIEGGILGVQDIVVLR